jgi:hypothetical protein
VTKIGWPPSGGHDDWLEETWRYREDVVYPGLLGRKSTGSIIPIPFAAFAQLGVEQVDPRWLHCGVLTFPPTAAGTGFVYGTSGLSNAWDDERPRPTRISGLGIELRIDTLSDEYWAKEVLLRISAMQLLVGSGRFTGARLLADGDRVRLSAETFGAASTMTSLLASAVADLQLPSGTFKMIQLYAISDAERDLAATQGADALVAVLREGTTFPVNDISRRSVV